MSNYQAAYRAALQSWANVANLTFTEVSSPGSARFIEHSVSGDFFSNDGTLGQHDVPDNPAPADGYYNYNGRGWDYNDPNGGLRVGGYAFGVMVHELGHGLGLAHPHDNGGGSTIWPGVTGPFNSYGSNNLDQGIFTVMSYNPGWDQVQNPDGIGLTNYGFVAGPMAFDIAAIQYLYGANTSYHTGGDTYTLPDTNAPGTYWTCIWDAGGVDQIVYGGVRNVVIDLTAATIDNSPTGGGVPSYAADIYGGFTIANGVVIENASAGSGNDTLTGNDVDNLLFGNGGSDLMFANGGRDTVDGGSGNNTIVGGRNSSDGADSIVSGNGNDFLFGNGGADTLSGADGNNTLVGGFGIDTVSSGSGSDLIWANQDNDFVTAGDGADTIWAGQGNDLVFANPGNDLIFGNEGNDTLVGGAGADLYSFATGSGADQITGFLFGEGDRITLQGQSYTFGNSGDGDALLLLSGGGTIELTASRRRGSNRASSFSPAWCRPPAEEHAAHSM